MNIKSATAVVAAACVRARIWHGKVENDESVLCLGLVGGNC